MQKIKIEKLLKRIKESIVLKDDIAYKRVTIRSKNQGITIRDVEFGVNIGTKKQFLIREGQFLLSKIDARNGAFGIVSETIDGAIITGNFWTFEVNRELLNIEWFNIFVSSAYFIDICSKASSGTTNRQYLDEKKFLDFEIQLPNLREQALFIQRYKSINEKFDTVSNELSKQQIYVRRLKEVILQEAIQGKLVEQSENDEPVSVLLEKIKEEKEKLIKEKKIKKEKTLLEITDEEKSFELPDGWKWVRLGSIGNLVNYPIVDGPFGSSINTKKDYIETGIPVIRMLNVKPFKFINNNLKFISSEKYESLKRHNILPRDVLFSKVGAGIGEACVVPDSFDYGLLSTTGVTRFRVGEIVLPEYLCYFLNYHRKEFVERASKTAQPFLNMSTIKNVLFALPPVNEQQRIVDKLNFLMEYCGELERNIIETKQESEKLLKAILQEAFTVKEEVLN
ncbi:restriction endonuclease subunit S [Bacillus cereus]|nr:restriction endonuclease subunit S [Bacillus cereus]